MRFRVPHQEVQPSLRELLERAWPEASPVQLERAFQESRVRVDERVTKNPAKVPDPDLVVELDAEPGEEPFGLPEASDLSRGEGWVVVDKAAGMPGQLDRDDPMHPVLFLADMLGVDRETFTPVWSMPTRAAGPWLIALSEDDAARLRQAYRSGQMMMTWAALTPEFGLPRGQITHEGIEVDYGISKKIGGLCEVQLTPQFHERQPEVEVAEFLLDLLEAQGAAVLGDRERGGYMVGGPLRLRLAALYDEASDIAYSWPVPQDWWPEDAIVPRIERDSPEAKPIGIPGFHVSSKTLEVVEEQHHPWILDDRETDSRERLRPGTLVRLRTRQGRIGPYALIEGPGELAARLWSDDTEQAVKFEEEIDLRLDEAISRRRELQRQLTTTDLFRLVHSEADGLPGFLLDRVGPVLRATLTGKTSFAFRERIYDNLTDFDPDLMILELPHLTDVRQGELPQARIVAHGSHYLRPGDRVIGLEDGLKYVCEPWEGIDVGFFADQRDNRRKLAALAEPGQRWLNLFCHTGAFSVRLASEGAEVVSVDISQRYLDWLEENLALNDLDPSSNTSVRQDAREYMASVDTRFFGIIVDPPTAASSDAGFWSVRKDYEKLLTHCFEALEPGGVMLVCRNDRKRKPALRSVVEAAASRAGWAISSIEPAPAGSDFPSVPGFPEGDTFEGLLVR